MKEGVGQICYYYKTIYRNEGRDGDGSNMCFIIIKLRFSSLRYM